MFILRCAVLLAAALSLSNCCLSSSGCSGPVALTAAPAPAAPGPVAAMPAWDGLNDQSAADSDATVDVTPPKKPGRRSKAAASVDAMSSQSTTASHGKVDWAEQQAVSDAEDARLRQKLIICNNCSASH